MCSQEDTDALKSISEMPVDITGGVSCFRTFALRKKAKRQKTKRPETFKLRTGTGQKKELEKLEKKKEKLPWFLKWLE